MIEGNENKSDVGFYVLPRTERECTPFLPHQLRNRLSVIREVSEDSSVYSTPASSPKVNHISSVFQETMSCQQEIVINTSGRGYGCSNLSSKR